MEAQVARHHAFARLARFASATLLALVSCAAPSAPSPEPTAAPTPDTGLMTLYALDPLRHAMSFGTDREGLVFQDDMVKNRESDLDYDNSTKGAFTVAIEGGRRGAIVDLGSSGDLAKANGFDPAAGGRGQGFASIRIQAGHFVILSDCEAQAVQPLPGAEALLGPLTQWNVSVPVVVDHVYLMRLIDVHDPDFERVVKLLVVACTPGESVTIRWVRLRG